MALYTQLPVFKRTYDLLLELVRTAVALQRVYKYTFGERLQQEAMDLVLDIYKANIARDKFAFLATARERLETIRLLVRLLHDIKQITPKRFLFLNIIMEDISKQLTGWQRMDKADNKVLEPFAPDSSDKTIKTPKVVAMENFKPPVDHANK